MTAPPHSPRLVKLRLVPTPWGPVKPLVHAPETIQSARISGIGVVDGAVLEHERTHARPVTHVGESVGSTHVRIFDNDIWELGCLVHRMAAKRIIVFDAPPTLLLL